MLETRNIRNFFRPAAPEPAPARAAEPAPATEPAGQDTVVQIAIDAIDENRQNFYSMEGGESFDMLVDSVRENGVLQPVLVAKGDAAGRFTLVAGHRRVRAARLAGLESVPALPLPSQGDGEHLVALIETNATIRDKSVADITRAIERLEALLCHRDIPGKRRDYIGRLLGLSGSQVQRYKALAKLSPSLRALLEEKRLAPSAAEQFATLPLAQQETAAQAIALALSETGAESFTRDDAKLLRERLLAQLNAETGASATNDTANGTPPSPVSDAAPSPALAESAAPYFASLHKPVLSVEDLFAATKPANAPPAGNAPAENAPAAPGAADTAAPAAATPQNRARPATAAAVERFLQKFAERLSLLARRGVLTRDHLLRLREYIDALL